MARKRVVFFAGVKSFLVPFLKPLILAVLVFSLIVGFGEKFPLLASQFTLKETEAATLIKDGKILLEKGLPESALKIWEEAENIYREIGNYKGIIGSQLNQGQALEAMGFTRDSCDVVLAAFPGLEVDKCDGLNDGNIKVVINAISYQPSPFNWMGLESLGNRLRLLGELEKSELVLEAVWKLAPERASIYLSLGNTARDLANLAKIRGENQDLNNQKERAIGYYKEAIALADGNLIGLQARLNWLSLLRDFKANQPAELIQEIDRQISDLFIGNDSPSRELVSALVNYAVTVKDIDKNKAIALLKEGINLAEELENLRLLSFAKGILGEVESNQEQLEEALAIALKIDAEDIAYRWEWQIGKMLKERGDREGAIAYYRSAFSILKKLRGNLVALNRDSQFNFRDEIEPIYREYADLLLQPEPGEKEPRQENIREAREVIEALQLAELDDFFREACVEVKEENLDKIVDENNSTTAVIYSILLEDSLDVIVKLPGKENLLHAKNLTTSESSTVNEVVEELRQSLRTPRTLLPQIRKQSKQLYDWLIAPFKAELELEITRENSQIKTLVFVLDDFLQNVPMAVLYDGESYLIERYAIAVTPGLQLVEPEPLEREKINALLAGASNAPSFKKENLTPLSGVTKELEKVSELVSNFQLAEQNFLEEKIKNQINSDPINVVHMATHGNFSSNPEDTFILDWEGRINVNELDNLLRVNTNRESREIQLLILSACKTAISDPRAALGLAGVAIKAGARSTLASLWQVEDNSTTDFMAEFYRELKNNPTLTLAEALRSVQLAFLRNDSLQEKGYNKPYHWAPFILVGSWL